MQQLRLERAKLDMQLGIEERELIETFHKVKGLFSISNAFGIMADAISGSPLLSGIASGYGMLSKLGTIVRNRINRCSNRY